MSGILSDDVALNLVAKLAAGRLVLFVGAGISFQARSPSDPSARIPLWDQLAQTVAKANSESLENYGGNLLDLFDGICGTQGRSALEDSVRDALGDSKFLPSKAHELIAELPWKMVVTTNYDSLLARAMNETEAIVSERDFQKLRRPDGNTPRLIHLHGDIKDMHTLTGEDYNLWDEKHPVSKHCLIEMGLNNTFLFIGYSNSDPHLRRGLFPLIRKLGQNQSGRNYAWMWKVTPQQMRVVDKNENIEVTCFDDDFQWINALQQLKDGLNKFKGSRNSSSPAKLRKYPAIESSSVARLRINGYKLFYRRIRSKLSIRELARRTGIEWKRIKDLEYVKKTAVSGEDCFAIADRQEIEALEYALSCPRQLQYGMEDDFLATYIMFYRVNRGAMGKHGSNSQLSFKPDTRAVVFDFGGTLTLPTPPYNTWERLWLSVGFDLKEPADLHRMYNHGLIDHQSWCDLTCEKLRSRGFTRKHLDEVAVSMQPVAGLSETFETLSARRIPISIVSGSIRLIIKKTLGDAYDLVDDTKCNDIFFDSNDLIREIRGHTYDFEGKAKYIERVIENNKCLPLEVLFVGNSLNDHWAIKSGARTLCVNPSHTDFTNALVWSDYIREMKSLVEILEYV